MKAAPIQEGVRRRRKRAPEDHAAAIVSEIERRFHEAHSLTATVSPEGFANFARHLDPGWIEEGLLSTDPATLRRRRLPADRVIWLVIGMALLRDRSIAEVVRLLELAIPGADEARRRSDAAENVSGTSHPIPAQGLPTLDAAHVAR
jgi:hypothetical protein